MGKFISNLLLYFFDRNSIGVNRVIFLSRIVILMLMVSRILLFGHLVVGFSHRYQAQILCSSTNTSGALLMIHHFVQILMVINGQILESIEVGQVNGL